VAERGAGQPKTLLTPSQVEVGYGQTLSSRGNGNNNQAGWFGPLTPLAPIAPKQVTGRQWDFISGYNIVVKPRTYEPISFEQLRALAYSYDLLRLVIETRKDQIERIKWTFRAKEGKKVSDARLQKITNFFHKPDGEHEFTVWLRAIINDLLILDAPTLWKERNRGGQLIGLHWMDGATIKPVIDDWGRTPKPYTENGQLIIPPAYQQVIKGYPAIDYTADELIYKPRNLQTTGPYGLGPVEQIVMTVNIALRRQLGTLDYYTEGNIPSALIGVPETWTPDQIKNFQDYWDAYFEGDLATRRRAKFVPGGVAKTFIATKEPELKNVFDEWLARIVCYAFNVSPQALVSQQNRATANTQKELAEEEGLHPLLMWVTRLINGVIEDDLDEQDVELAIGDDTQIAPTDEATILVAYSGAAILTKNEVRQRLGEEPVATPEADQLGYTTATGFVPLDNTLKPPPLPPLAPVGPDGKPVQPKLPNAPVKTAKEGNDKPAKNPDSNKDAEKLAKDIDASGHNHGAGGRFAPKNDGMTAAERRKAKRRAKNGVTETASGHLRDKAGNLRSSDGTFVQGQATSTKDFREKLASAAKKAISGAAILGGGAAIAAVLAPSAIGLPAVALTLAAAGKIGGHLLWSAAEEALGAVLDEMGVDKAIAGTVIDPIVHTVKESVATQFGKVNKASPVHEANQAEYDYAMDIAQKFLPIFFEQFFDKLEEAIDNEAPDMDTDTRDSLSDMFGEMEQTALDAIATTNTEKVSKSDDFFPLGTTLDALFNKAARRIAPLPFDRPATRKAHKAVRARVAGALKAAWSKVRPVLQKRLASEAEKLAKADNYDLSAIDSIDISDDISPLASDSATSALAQVGPDVEGSIVNQVNSRAVTWAQKQAAALVGKRVLADGTVIDNPNSEYSITDTTRDLIRDKIANGLADNIGTQAIIDSIEEEGFSEDRAELIAQTEIGNANSAGALIGYQGAAESGIRVKKAWLTTGDAKVDSDICKANEDQGPIDLDDNFQSGHSKPLGHPRCRCSLIPVVVED